MSAMSTARQVAQLRRVWTALYRLVAAPGALGQEQCACTCNMATTCQELLAWIQKHAMANMHLQVVFWQRGDWRGEWHRTPSEKSRIINVPWAKAAEHNNPMWRFMYSADSNATGRCAHV
jgi:uncharacterized membrane protein